ncbi:RagB/SusD family nutrient uptake outer membrane protein [Bacteroides sp. UBA939]|uniref:RagB/SusD family nutrient uptake outer membrane protein n=1 Tax=Bacteroides sp. UBA939 TaxID=1946092 RepID=UPI0025BEBAED|nr:RagB/SusD family nutrient uptake outer membrane protein [Bacteroides sp. UBA939]
MKLTKILATCTASVLMMSSCSLDEEVYTSMAGEVVAQEGNYSALVAGAYSALGYLFEWGAYHEAINLDCDYQSGPAWAFTTIGNGNFYNNSSLDTFYFTYAQIIDRANYHYYLVNQVAGAPEKLKKNALGELRFLKAWALFEMVQVYGPIPLYKYSIEEGNDVNLPRSSVKEVYEHIIETLQEAETLLMPRNDADYAKGHVCRGTAKALLAKVYATIGSASMTSGSITVKGGPPMRTNEDGQKTRLMPQPITHQKNQVAGYEEFDSKEYYQLARAKALEVLTEGEFRLSASQEALWSYANKNGTEFQFCLQTLPVAESIYGNFIPQYYYGYWNTASYDVPVWSSGWYTQRDHWLQIFDDWEDERITWGVVHRYPGSYNNETKVMTWNYYPERDSVYVRKGERGYEPTDKLVSGAYYGSKLMKFSCTAELQGDVRLDYNWPFMRYAETYLIFAEADNEVNNGPSAEALSRVSELNRRNNSTTAIARNERTPFTQESFRSYILEERSKEFAAEGIRRNDLLRWGIYIQVMNAIGYYDENDNIKEREEKHLLLPLPVDEVNANPNIDRNNPGW